MASGYNTNLQMMIQQAMSQLQSVSGTDASSFGTSAAPTYVNSIWGITQNAQAAFEGNDEQKAQASINIINGLLGMISFAKNQQAKANQEVNRNSQAIDQNAQAADAKAQEIEQKIEAIAANIGNNTINIQNALAEIQALGGNGGQIAELQEQIKAQLQIIEENKANLNNPEKRQEALEAIQAAAGAINMIVGSIQNMQTTIEEQNAIVEQSVNEISQNIEESATQISQGVTDIQQYIQNGTQLGTTTTQITTQGSTDIPTGKAEVKAGEAMNSNAVSAIGSGGKGVKLVMDGNERMSAGQTRIQGGAQNLRSLVTSIGKMGTDVQELSAFTNSIGQLGDGATSLAEQYMSSVQPYIEATGTWDVDAIIEANAQLQADVTSLFDGNQQVNNTENQNTGAQNNGQEAFLDTTKLRTAFGI